MADEKPQIKSVARSRICIAEDLLPRVASGGETLLRYIELLKEGNKFPPLDVFELAESTGTLLHLVDGTYRLRAYDLIHRSLSYKVKVAIHQGTRSEALWFAAGANQDHGLPLTQAQRMHALEALLADPVTAKKSDRQIALQCGVSHGTVGIYRSEHQEGLPLSPPEGRSIDQGVPPVTPSDSGGDESADSAGAEDGDAHSSGAPVSTSGSGEPAGGSPPAPAEWPEPIKQTIMEGTEILKNLASLCRDLERDVKDIAEVRRPGTAMFHAAAALERLRRLRLAITRAAPYCVCPECKTKSPIDSLTISENCPRCHGRGWLVRAETDETLPTPGQFAQLEARDMDVATMPKKEAARQLDDIFAAETWQERAKVKLPQLDQDEERDSTEWD